LKAASLPKELLKVVERWILLSASDYLVCHSILIMKSSWKTEPSFGQCSFASKISLFFEGFGYKAGIWLRAEGEVYY